MTNRSLFLTIYVCAFICGYSQNLQLDHLHGLFNENFEKGLYKEACDFSSKYISTAEYSGIKENPNYSNALMIQALCIMLIDNSIDEFNILSNKSLEFEYERNKCSDYYQELVESRNKGLLFFLQRNLNNIKEISSCLDLIKDERISLSTDSIGIEIDQICTILASYKGEIYSLYHEAISNYSNGNFIISYKTACQLKSLLDDIFLTHNSLYAECNQIIGLSSLLGKEDYEEFSRAMGIAINIEYKLMGLNYLWYLQCYADGLTRYSKTLRFPRNINLLKKAVDIYESLPDTEGSGYPHALFDLSVCYNDIDVFQSIRLAEKALAFYKQMESPDTITVYSYLSDFYSETAQYDKAIEYGLRVVNYWQNYADNEGLRIIYKRLAKVYARKKDFEGAILYAKKSLVLSNNVSPTLYAEILNNLGIYYIGTKEYCKGRDYLVQSYICEESKNNTYNLAGVYAKLNNPDSCKYYTDKTREIIVDEFLRTYKTLEKGDRFNYLHTQNIYHLLYTPVQMCVNWGFDELTNAAYNCLIQNKSILNSSFNIEDIKSRITLKNIDAVKSQLTPNDVAIEIWSNRDSALSNSDEIYAFAIKKDWNNAKLIRLSRDSIYKTLRNEISTTEKFLPLYEYIWKPLLSQIDISEGDTIYIALDDILTQVPIENICGYDWKYIGDKYVIHRISDTNKIAASKKSTSLKSAVLYGGALNSCVVGETIPEGHILSSINRKCLEDLKNAFEYLPWSKIEVNNASSALCQLLPSKNIRVMTDSMCTKSSVVLLSGISPSVLHFAVHGFNMSKRTCGNMDTGYDGHLFAMNHTGLVFSNIGSPNNDFMLSASEIAQLDLSSTDLVILSSCSSGIGSFSSLNIDSELTYAFKRAGVQSLIVTLSRIDDAAISYFMNEFYKNLASGLSKHDAFKVAQSSLRKSEEFSKFPYWAYIVMID